VINSLASPIQQVQHQQVSMVTSPSASASQNGDIIVTSAY